MINVNEAKKIIFDRQSPKHTTVCQVLDSLHAVLAENIASPLDFPRFNSSAMDGYALRSDDTISASENHPVILNIVDDIWAGKSITSEIQSQQCTRIMTGAAVPASADAIIAKENIILDRNMIHIKSPVQKGENIRRQGEEIKSGDVVLKRGTPITPGVAGILASFGLETCKIFERPKVTVISTGTELVRAGKTLDQHQIYESNSTSIAFALKTIGIEPQLLGPIPDDPELIYNAVKSALDSSTHVILCGGVSVGEHDHNKSVLADLGVHTEFWRINQKPGKPFFYGTCGETHVFGVPGNPASSLICYYEYIEPALKKYAGQTNISSRCARATLTHDIRKNDNKTHFLRAKAKPTQSGWTVEVLGKQGSHMMSAFAEANCIVVLEESLSELTTGTEVEIHWLISPPSALRAPSPLKGEGKFEVNHD